MSFKCQGTVTTIKAGQNEVSFTFKSKTQLEYYDKPNDITNTYNIVFNQNPTNPDFKGIPDQEEINITNHLDRFLPLLEMAYEEEAIFEFEKSSTDWELNSIKIGQ